MSLVEGGRRNSDERSTWMDGTSSVFARKGSVDETSRGMTSSVRSCDVE
jgi:hypothetical protein